MKRNNYSLKKYLHFNYILLIVLAALAITLSGVSIILYIFLDKGVVLYILLGLVFFLLSLIILAFVFLFKRIHSLLYEEAFMVNQKNVEALKSFGKDFAYLPHDKFIEFHDLNRAYHDLSNNLDGRTVISKSFVYEDIPLFFVNDDDVVVSYDSLITNLNKLILASESYRNALIDLSYELDGGVIDEKDEARIIENITKILSYERVLVARKNSGDGYLVYVPAFDSLSQLKEELESLIKSMAVFKATNTGKKAVNAAISVVVYPYSDIDNMLEDLKVAVRQKKILNFYFPKKESKPNDKMLLTAMNVNNISKLIEDVTSIDASPKDYEKNLVRIEDIIRDAANYYGFECSGLITYEPKNDAYLSKYVYSPSKIEIFKKDSKINKHFVNATNAIQDKDHSYYFSSRKHINDNFARYIDEYGVRSGLIYSLTQGEKCIGFIYFFNKNKDMSFDSYMRESLINTCHLLGSVFKEMEARNEKEVYDKRFKDTMKLSSVYMYSVSKDKYELNYVSDAMRKLVPSKELGKRCYKAIYGRETPCPNCPLKKNRHFINELKGQKFECYQVLNNDRDDDAHIILKAKSDDFVSERFDSETLLSTFYSFKQAMDDQYLLNKEGHILFVKLVNHKKIVKNHGNSGFNDFIREYSELASSNDGIDEIYQYGNATLATILSADSEDEVIQVVEAISAKVKDVVNRYEAEICYFDLQYKPDLDINTLLKQADDALKQDIQDQEILFINTGYRRSASKEGYLFDIVKSAFENETFKMYFQPILSNNSRLVVGAELLLRITDEKTEKFVDIGAALAIARERGYSKVVSKGILKYYSNLLDKYGYTFFMSTGINHLAINADYDFFCEESFAAIDEIVKKNNLPKGFLAIQVAEWDLHAHKDDYVKYIEEARSHGAAFSISSYSGEYFTIEELDAMGVKDVKISRNLVLALNDVNILNKVNAVWEYTSKHGMSITFVGVENRLLSDKIHLEDNDCFVQGNFFYAPMEEEALIETVRERNMKDE